MDNTGLDNACIYSHMTKLLAEAFCFVSEEFIYKCAKVCSANYQEALDEVDLLLVAPVENLRCNNDR